MDGTAAEKRMDMGLGVMSVRSSLACATCRRSKIKCINEGPNTVCTSCRQKNHECTYLPRAQRDCRMDQYEGRQTSRDPLETPLITLKLWHEIYDIFMLHYSAELPFLHKQTFFDRIITGIKSYETQLFLLGVLSLTARYVPELVLYHHPSDASEYYAHALEAQLNMATIATNSLDVLQALLMLGLHKWGMCCGLGSWMYLGVAIRY